MISEFWGSVREKLSRKMFLIARVGLTIKIKHGNVREKVEVVNHQRLYVDSNIISFLLSRIQYAYERKTLDLKRKEYVLLTNDEQ